MTHHPASRSSDSQVNGVGKTDVATETRGSLPHTLPQVCFELQAKLDAFLDEETDDKVLQNVQNRVRVSMDVIREALRRYG